MQDEVKRTLKIVPDLFKTNNPHDFFCLDYRLSFFLSETRRRIEDAEIEFQAKIGKILDDDRDATGMSR